ncbi:MAG: two-component regulator propeller domain-containing protein [Desulfocapsaceae bacterium]|nr:two-component regulator propeller domain-containing protein [Desulfocapsaceae bacterium]
MTFNRNTFTAENSDLPDNNVLCIALASEDTIWVGTENGLARLQQGQWEVLRKETIGCASDRIYEAKVTSDGAVWFLIGSSYQMPEVARYYQGEWQVFEKNGRIPGKKLWDWLAAPDGALWVSTDEGLSRFFEGKWQHFSNADMGISQIKRGDWVYDRALAATPDGTVYVGVSGAGMLSRLKDGKWQLFTPENSGLPYNWVQTFRIEHDKALWILSEGNLVRFQQNQWQVYAPKDLDLPENDFVKDEKGIQNS